MVKFACVLLTMIATAGPRLVTPVKPVQQQDSYQYHYDQATLAIADGDLNRARAELLRAIELNPDHVLSHYNLGFIAMTEGQTEEARRRFEKTLALDPRFALAHVNLGILHATEGQLDEARKAFEAAVEAEPTNARAMFNLGTFYLRQQQLDLAEREFQKIAQIAPYVARSLTNLGEIYMSQGLFAQAEEVLRSALDHGADDWKTHFLLGRSYLELRQPANAIQYLERAEELEGGVPEIAVAVGDAQLELANLDEAEAAYRRAIASEASGTRPHFQLAQVYFNQNRYALALDELEAVLQEDSEHAGAFYLRGMIHFRQSNLEAAESDLARAIELEPWRAQAHFALGNVYMRQEKTAEGQRELEIFDEINALVQKEEELRKQVAVEPRNASLRLELARVYYEMGQLEAAEDVLETTLRLEPDFEEATELLEEVRQTRPR